MGRHKEPNRATVESRTERWRESIQASSIMNRLKNHGDGKLEKPLDQTQIKAYEVILDRIAPKLSAVEQTTVNEWDNMSEDQLWGQIQALILSKPEYIARLRELTSGPHEVASGDSPASDSHTTAVSA